MCYHLACGKCLWEARGARGRFSFMAPYYGTPVLQQKRGEKRKQHMLSLSRARVVRRKVAVGSEKLT